MYAAMDGFKQACEDSNVMYALSGLLKCRMAGFTDAMGSQSVASSVGSVNWGDTVGECRCPIGSGAVGSGR